jgi:hypothetical protein
LTATGPRPRRAADQAAAYALSMVGHGVYRLGTGDVNTAGEDERDCFGFAYCEAYQVRRHRPGYNRGPWASVEDDLNCNSAIEDAHHAGELFEVCDRPELGALLTYPTIRLAGHPKPWIGHIGIIVGVSRCLEWDQAHPHYALLDVVQCRGPNGRRPGIVATDGSVWDQHDATWPRPEHRTVMLRAKP